MIGKWVCRRRTYSEPLSRNGRVTFQQEDRGTSDWTHFPAQIIIGIDIDVSGSFIDKIAVVVVIVVVVIIVVVVGVVVVVVVLIVVVVVVDHASHHRPQSMGIVVAAHTAEADHHTFALWVGWRDEGRGWSECE